MGRVRIDLRNDTTSLPSLFRLRVVPDSCSPTPSAVDFAIASTVIEGINFASLRSVWSITSAPYVRGLADGSPPAYLNFGAERGKRKESQIGKVSTLRLLGKTFCSGRSVRSSLPQARINKRLFSGETKRGGMLIYSASSVTPAGLSVDLPWGQLVLFLLLFYSFCFILFLLRVLKSCRQTRQAEKRLTTRTPYAGFLYSRQQRILDRATIVTDPENLLQDEVPAGQHSRSRGGDS